MRRLPLVLVLALVLVLVLGGCGGPEAAAPASGSAPASASGSAPASGSASGSAPASASASASASGSAPASVSPSPARAALEAKLSKQYCSGPPMNITILEDGGGVPGGYYVSARVMDSGITYYDTDGKRIGSFHIFAPAAENDASKPAIDALRKRYPVERSVKCM